MMLTAKSYVGVLALFPMIAGCGPIDTRSEAQGSLATGDSGGTSAGGGAGTAGASGAAGAASASGGASGAGPACAGIVFEENVRVADYDTDRFSWNDANCRPRQAAMVRVGGGYVRQFVYEVDGAPRVATGTNANNFVTGWGYSVSHFGSTGSVGKDRPGSFEPLFVGPHHAIYQYEFTQIISGQEVPITFHWFFSTARSNPVLAITYDMTGIPKGSIQADIRTPYGDIAWTGDENVGKVAISGVGWGDRYKFKTTSAPLTMNSTWDYTQPNSIPYVIEWTDAPDAEMGAVQTQTYTQHDAGGYWYYSNWGKTSDNRSPDTSQVGNMPSTWNWPYQLNQYELCMESMSCVNNTTSSHRLAWGTNYGALGGSTSGSEMYPAFGDDKQLAGYPYQSFSVFMVLGKHTSEPVYSQVAEIENVQKTRLTASVGTVVTNAPGGVGRSDELTLDPPGYDARYAVWAAQASGNQLELQADVDGSLNNPVLVVSDYSSASAPAVTLNGTVLTPDVDYVVSLDAAAHKAWLTFRRPWAGSTHLSVSGN